MATLYEVFDLLPPPPPTVFSRADPHNDRARFPDFLATSDPAQACRDFMQMLFMPRMQLQATVQFLVLGSLIAIIVPAATFVVAYRIYKKRFWLFRLVPTHGKVPILCFNSSNAFIVFGGLALVAVAAAIGIEVSSFGYQVRPIHHFGFLYCWTWVPLLIAVFYNAWGLAHAKTSTDPGVAAGSRGWIEQYFQRYTILANIFQVASPVLLALPPMIISAFYEIDGERALNLWENEWRVKYADGPLTQEMLREAQEIWYSECTQSRPTSDTGAHNLLVPQVSLRGFFFIALAFVFWTIVLPIFGVFHHTILWSIIRDLRASIQGVMSNDSGGGRSHETVTVREDEKEAPGFFPPVFIPKVVKTPTRKLLLYVNVMYWVILSAAFITDMLALSAALTVYNSQGEQNCNRHGAGSDTDQLSPPSERATGGVVEPALFLALSWMVGVLGYISAAVILWGDFETTFSAMLLKDFASSTGSSSRRRAKSNARKGSAIQLRLLEETIVVSSLTSKPNHQEGNEGASDRQSYGGEYQRPFHEMERSATSITGESVFAAKSEGF